MIAASAGNHAQGLAYHATRLGIPSTIVMPKNTPIVKVTQTEHHGANVILEGETFDAAYAHSRQLEAEHGFTFVHPSTIRASSRARAPSRSRWSRTCRRSTR